MVLHRPDRRQSFAAAVTLLGCALLSGGFSLASGAAEERAAPPGPDTLQIVLQIPPEPVIAPRPPMTVLPADASRAFDLASYRHEIAALRSQAAAEARLYAERSAGTWEAQWSDSYDLDAPPQPYEPAF